MQNKFSAPFDGFLDPFLPPSVSHFLLSTSIIPNIAEMEQRHEDELRNLKANHNQLEARVRCPQGDEYSAHTIPEHTQGESHPDTQSAPKMIPVSHKYIVLKGGLLINTPWSHKYTLTLGWKPLN